jgi:hypothetical protein
MERGEYSDQEYAGFLLEQSIGGDTGELLFSMHFALKILLFAFIDGKFSFPSK